MAACNEISITDADSTLPARSALARLADKHLHLTPFLSLAGFSKQAEPPSSSKLFVSLTTLCCHRTCLATVGGCIITTTKNGHRLPTGTSLWSLAAVLRRRLSINLSSCPVSFSCLNFLTSCCLFSSLRLGK